MPRRCRALLPDGVFHVIDHAVAEQLLFRDDVDRRLYLGHLQIAAERSGWKVMAFVLMDTHVHLVVEAPVRRLSEGMWWLKWRYAQRYKLRHEPPRGHVFCGRFKSLPVEDEPYLYAVLRYVVLNPVAAGICDRAEDFRWSSDRVVRGIAPTLPLVAAADVLALFGEDLAQYESFVDGEDPPAHHRVSRAVHGVPNDRPPLTELLAQDSPLALVLAYDVFGYTLAEIGAHLGIHLSTVHRRLARSR